MICLLIFIGCTKQQKQLVPKAKTESVEKLQLPSTNDLLRKKPDTLNVPIAKVNGFDLVYDCMGCRQTISDSIAVYAKKDSIKKLLFKLPILDFYVDDVSHFKYKGYDFIYVGSTHTYGHSQGYLYYLNTRNMETYAVEIRPTKRSPTSKSEDTLEIHKYFDLTKDEHNNLGGGASYWEKKTRHRYYSEWSYSLVKAGKNKFVLVSKNDEKWSEDY
ncbi:hypothetical protein [Flavobacterium silvaticum]|uniref:Uncharacterized protein n=1 Tax=Flavobacterium silvaticum TaxID=1852020 RepID=A0A972JGF9_9FLAO|nr:hypothetical protein [Flavobacterium silvaticum]NMH26820.1 hypothetical protein [Flavobacterium silvaticum]